MPWTAVARSTAKGVVKNHQPVSAMAHESTVVGTGLTSLLRNRTSQSRTITGAIALSQNSLGSVNWTWMDVLKTRAMRRKKVVQTIRSRATCDRAVGRKWTEAFLGWRGGRTVFKARSAASASIAA